MEQVSAWLEGASNNEFTVAGMPGSTFMALVRVILVILPILTLVPGIIWWERRLLSWMQDRIGPNRSGTITLPNGRQIRTFGLIQPLLDGVKLFLKEEIKPSAVDRLIYVIAPALALFPAFALGATLPWTPHTGFWGHFSPAANIDIGILWVLAISSLGAYGIVLAGYSSNNKYSLMGGLRASAQLISYELAMGVSLACIALATGSLKMTDMVAEQEKALWGVIPQVQNWFLFTPFGLLSAVIFLIALVAETNRAPFDLPEAENELIAGYHTEYSSMKFAVFFMGEYAAMFVFSGVFAAVFMGGYHFMPFNYDELAVTFPSLSSFWYALRDLNYWLGPAGFLVKQIFMLSFFIWLRATLPRLRYDQLMNLGWKSLLPTAVANFIIVGIWIVATEMYGVLGGWVAFFGAVALLALLYFNLVSASRKSREAEQRQAISLVDGTERRSITLVDPAPASSSGKTV
ncbi:MAG TPA: NADH-quinone oxidoreductase subunit H [Fimbriimonadaceae bacterium]|nr:NADH-quinone oxidoreductase subunit H [Fimbriimonadaceae bacterium]